MRILKPCLDNYQDVISTTHEFYPNMTWNFPTHNPSSILSLKSNSRQQKGIQNIQKIINHLATHQPGPFIQLSYFVSFSPTLTKCYQIINILFQLGLKTQFRYHDKQVYMCMSFLW